MHDFQLIIIQDIQDIHTLPYSETTSRTSSTEVLTPASLTAGLIIIQHKITLLCKIGVTAPAREVLVVPAMMISLNILITEDQLITCRAPVQTKVMSVAPATEQFT